MTEQELLQQTQQRNESIKQYLAKLKVKEDAERKELDEMRSHFTTNENPFVKPSTYI